MKLALASVLVAMQLTVVHGFFWRLYNNGGCDHNSPPAATFPPNPTAPRSSDLDLCINAPQGIAWNRLELDTSSAGNLDAFVFCSANCSGAVLETVADLVNACAAGFDGCTIASFIVFPPS
ncbi:hypothetical protein DFH09DRAFT_374870 [Mycena vulgaris]|nr:hypothetical protein DFH09DRAFT_374870 [Mycena vulgaris]